MIRSYRQRDVEQLHDGIVTRRVRAVAAVAQRKLVMLEAATELRDLAQFPGNRLEALKGDRAGFYSIRVNDQFRIVFRWVNGDAYDVDLVDYHR